MVHWDKKLAEEIRSLGIEHEKAITIVGIVAEHRQIADLQGYKRGYNNGYYDATVASTLKAGKNMVPPIETKVS